MCRLNVHTSPYSVIVPNIRILVFFVSLILMLKKKYVPLQQR